MSIKTHIIFLYEFLTVNKHKVSRKWCIDSVFLCGLGSFFRKYLCIFVCKNQQNQTKWKICFFPSPVHLNPFYINCWSYKSIDANLPITKVFFPTIIFSSPWFNITFFFFCYCDCFLFFFFFFFHLFRSVCLKSIVHFLVLCLYYNYNNITSIYCCCWNCCYCFWFHSFSSFIFFFFQLLLLLFCLLI